MTWKQRLAVFIATTGLSGYFPIAPGTVGSLIAIVVLFILPPLAWWVLVLATVLVYLVGIRVAFVCERLWQEKDAGKINWDEVAGMMVTVIAVPHSALAFASAFFLFRIMDIVKPFPARQLEPLPHGWGVMSDDIMAGIYANIVLQILFRWAAILPG